MISLDGSVTKPELGLDFSNYQSAMAQYQTTPRLREKVREKHAKADVATSEQDRQNPEAD